MSRSERESTCPGQVAGSPAPGDAPDLPCPAPGRSPGRRAGRVTAGRQGDQDDLSLTYVKASVRGPTAEPGHRWSEAVVGWLPSEGWFCSCGARRPCMHITYARLTIEEN